MPSNKKISKENKTSNWYRNIEIVYWAERNIIANWIILMIDQNELKRIKFDFVSWFIIYYSLEIITCETRSCVWIDNSLLLSTFCRGIHTIAQSIHITLAMNDSANCQRWGKNEAKNYHSSIKWHIFADATQIDKRREQIEYNFWNN